MSGEPGTKSVSAAINELRSKSDVLLADYLCQLLDVVGSRDAVYWCAERLTCKPVHRPAVDVTSRFSDQHRFIEILAAWRLRGPSGMTVRAGLARRCPARANLAMAVPIRCLDAVVMAARSRRAVLLTHPHLHADDHHALGAELPDAID